MCVLNAYRPACVYLCEVGNKKKRNIVCVFACLCILCVFFSLCAFFVCVFACVWMVCAGAGRTEPGRLLNV